MRTTLIKNAAVLSMDPALGDLSDGDILLAGDRIAAVGAKLDAPEGTEVIDARGMIALPGLINAHQHTWQTGIRGVAGDWTLTDYGRHMHAGLATRFTPNDIYLANLVGALNQLNGGVTTLFDWCHNNPTPEHSDRAIDGLSESGIRAVFGHGTPKPKLDEHGVPTQEYLHPEDEVKRLRHGRLASEDALVTMALCIRGPDLSSYEASAADLKLARDYGVVASCHIGGRKRAVRKTPDGIAQLAAAGLLGPDFNLVHANKLSDDELRVAADAGTSFTVTPEVEMQMGHGLPVTGRLLKLGARPSVGIDVESNISGELLWAARFALQVQRGLDNAAAHAQGSELAAVSISSRQALEWVTIDGARALRMEHKIGSLTPGKQADLILVRSGDLNLFPSHDPLETVLFHSNSSNVDSVFVAGQALKRNGALAYSQLGRKKADLLDSGKRLLRE
ncbi:MAG TPA: amidohydrolase family protein [Pseudolabrys sp.]|nr:amidohydrolase family protein [Pseudolabrys sp.]